MTLLHRDLTREKWQSMDFLMQMANVGTEIGRTINWKLKDEEKSDSAFERGLELLDLTIDDSKNRSHLSELCRLKEVLVDYFVYDNAYGSTDEKWNSYFYGFSHAAAVNLKK